MSDTASEGIDHLVVAVTDIERAAAACLRLGFTLSRRSASDRMGTAAHTIMLRSDYLELLAVVTPMAANLRWQEALARRAGLAGIALATDDTAAIRAAWNEARLAPSDVRASTRLVERPDGTVEARFEVVSLPKDALAAMSLFACRHLTPDAVWLPELTSHPNTACGIRRVVVASADPAADAAVLMRALPGASARAGDDGVRMRFGRNVIVLLRDGVSTEAGRGPLIELGVSDVAACRAALRRGEVPMRVAGDRTEVAAANAFGVALVFAPASAAIE